MTTYYCLVESPIGELLITCANGSITRLYMDTNNGNWEIDPNWTLDANEPTISLAKSELAEYFSGKRTEFTVSANPSGTDFQKSVWRELCNIPYSKTISYGELAKRIGNPSASRAVGLANGSNPVSIIIPCHRVIGANGKLTGYGGGLERKEHLLNLESGTIAMDYR